MRINQNTRYLEKRTTGSSGHTSKRKINEDKNWRDWYLIKYNSNGYQGYINLAKNLQINFPKHLVGKFVRLKVEIYDHP